MAMYNDVEIMSANYVILAVLSILLEVVPLEQ